MAKTPAIKAEKYAQIDAELLAAMGSKVTALYAAKQAADQTAKAAREAFEAAFTTALRSQGVAIPPDHKPLFGYMYGVAIGTDAKGSMMFKPIAKAKAASTGTSNPIAALFASKPKGKAKTV